MITMLDAVGIRATWVPSMTAGVVDPSAPSSSASMIMAIEIPKGVDDPASRPSLR